MKSTPLDSGPTSALLESFRSSLRPGQLFVDLFDIVPDVHFFVKDRESRFMGGSVSFANTLSERSIEPMLGKTDHDYSPDFLADAFCPNWVVVAQTGN